MAAQAPPLQGIVAAGCRRYDGRSGIL